MIRGFDSSVILKNIRRSIKYILIGWSALIIISFLIQMFVLQSGYKEFQMLHASEWNKEHAAAYDTFYNRHFYQAVIGHLIIWILVTVTIIYFSKKSYKQIEELKASEERFFTFLDESPFGVILVDRSGKVIYANPIVETSMPKEFREGRWKEKYDYEIWVPELLKKFKLGLEEVFEKNKNVTTEITFDIENHPVHLQMHKFPIKDNDGTTIVASTSANLTQRKIAEQKIVEYMQELEDMHRTKDKLMSVIAHDLRSPFHPMLGITEIMIEDFDTLSTDDIKNNLKEIHGLLRNQYQLLDNLLDWSLLHNGKIHVYPAKLDLYESTNEVIKLYEPGAEMKNIVLLNLLPHALNIETDKHIYSMVLRNLIYNAIKFTPANGTVEISSATKENFVVINVTDSGKGITKENLEKIFDTDASFTTKGTQNEKGTGLGLQLCKDLLKVLGGELTAVSNAGKGSTFSFSLPLYNIEKEKAPQRPS